MQVTLVMTSIFKFYWSFELHHQNKALQIRLGEKQLQ